MRRTGPRASRHAVALPRDAAGDGPLSRYDFYERCVQSPPIVVRLLRAIHGGDPAVLAEDFCGTAAVAREWVRQVAGGRAVATDRDPEPLARARGCRGVRLVRGDVLDPGRTRRERADVIFVGNFSIGEIHDRPGLVAYLRRCRARLRPGGAFVCDTYGGESAFTAGSVRRIINMPGGRRIVYTWEQRRADPATARVVNAMHFRVERDGWVEQTLHDAFVYDWRLWSVPELRDALAEAGFGRSEIYDRLPDAVDGEGRPYVRPIADPRDLDASFIVCVAGRRERSSGSTAR